MSTIMNDSVCVTYRQAARLLNVSESMVRKLVREQKLLKVKLGRSARIPVNELSKLAAANNAQR